MKSKKSLALAAMLALSAATAQAGCAAHVGRSGADPMALVVAPTSLSVDTEDGRRTITTLGTITNPTGVCFTDLVVEVQYFDAAGQHVDTVVEPLAGVVAPAGEPAEFRVQGPAARDAKAYASQRVRVTDGLARWTKGGEPSRGMFVDLLLSWAPMLLLIAVWLYLVRRQAGAKGIQGRMLAIMEAQQVVIQEQNQAVQRIAAALEKRAGMDTAA